MPNHVTNIITYEGDRKKIAEMLEAIKNDELGIGTVDFQKIIPIYIEEISRINNLAQRYDGGCQYAELLISNYDTSERAKMAKQLSFFDENGGLII